MSFTYLIEVAVTPDTSTTERGRILERFGRRFLETQNYSVKEEVRLTASEVDLLGTENTTGELIFVECKAHRSNISSEVLQKLLGNVTFKDYSSGWLISTFALGKDAKGFEHEWQQRPPEQRRKMRIYSPDRLADRLVAAKLIVPVETLQFHLTGSRVGNEAFLLLTQNGEFWALPVVDPATGIRSAALLFHASNGEAVRDLATLEWIATTDTSLSLPWICDTAKDAGAATKLRSELESIVKVPMADHWADYRPARPEDFVGREAVQTSVFNFLDHVRSGGTTTRLIALKGPSGWGKSSSLLKIASRATNARNKGKYYVFTVDSRAATTRRFPELAVVSAVKEAVRSGFVSAPSDLAFGGASSLFSTPGMRHVVQDLRDRRRVLCIFFDQFEELLYKADLVEVFDEMRRICAAVEEAQANVVIGFSWKTDGVIPTEHSAYHMWHSLADRRFEIELTPFSEAEVGLAINRFAKELGSPLIPQLRRVLQDHCQGFPWLLKKLCVHILDQSKVGTEQADILTSSLNIQALFKKDLEDLSSAETGCIKQIAIESPAEFFKITQNFGDGTVSRLVDKRLVIRSGTRLTLYWDIFRDYILTERIPYIPVTYVPQANFSRYAKALAYMNGKSELSYADLAAEMNLGMGATDNLVRDLVNVGHVDAHRKENRIIPTFADEQHALDIAFSFWRSHEVVRLLIAGKGDSASLSEAEFVAVYRTANKRSALGEGTVQAYAQRMLRWLIGIGLVQQSGEILTLRDGLRSSVASLDMLLAKRIKQSDFFLGEAPPIRVVSAFASISAGTHGRSAIKGNCDRNSFYALMKLGLVTAEGGVTVEVPPEAAEATVRKRAGVSTTVEFVRSLEISSLSGFQVGERVAEHFRVKWSEGSKRRNGSALKKWADWVARGDATAAAT